MILMTTINYNKNDNIIMTINDRAIMTINDKNNIILVSNDTNDN